MTENVVPTEIAQDIGIQQIPAVVPVTELPAAAAARDQLLQAIAREAQQVTDKRPGEASAALEQLARAYALVASPAAALAPRAGTLHAGSALGIEWSPE